MASRATLARLALCVVAAGLGEAVACGTNETSFGGADEGGTADGAFDAPSTDDSGMFAGGDSAAPGDGCASANAKPVRVPATVWVVADISGVETFSLSSASLGQLRASLLGTGGLIPSLQAVDAFGFVAADYYSGTGCPATDLDCGVPPEAGTPGCPGMHIVAPALMNAAAIASAFPTTAHDANPRTYDALSYAVSQLPSAAEIASHPVSILLAFRGTSEDYCGNELDISVQSIDAGPLADPGYPGIVYDPTWMLDNIIALVRVAAARGAKVFTMNMGDTNPEVVQAHQLIAAAGNTGMGPFTPQTAADLQSALEQVLTASFSCDISLLGTVAAGQECTGTVTADGQAIACDDPNGWKLKDPGTIEFVGAACTNLQRNPQATVHATFPCGAFMPPR
jgi:hypothetical protein